MSEQPRWMIYGANGFTGSLIAEEAVRRGHKPILAGRHASKLAPIAARLGLEHVAVRLNDTAGLPKALTGVALVVHCAGPFIFTSLPMVRACLIAGAHYLDITGEIPVFENIWAYDSSARAKKIALIPGCGFDVVPTDCLAAYVAAKIKDPVELEIAFDAIGSMSRGSLLTSIEGFARGGLERRGGHLTALPFGQGVMTVQFPHGPKTVTPIPWGDLATAYRSTGIPNISTSMRISRSLAGTLQVVGPLVQVLLMAPPLRALAKWWVGLTTRGPSAAAMAKGKSYIWARATDVRGGHAEAWLEAVEGYRFTALSTLLAVEKTLAGNLAGALTPSQAFGPDFVLEIEGTKRYDSLAEFPQDRS